jgi:hypothetical protein
MALYGIEAVVREVLSVLSAGMATKLSGFSYSDGLTPAAPPAENFLTYVPRPLPSPPLVIVLAQPETGEAENIGSELPTRYAVQVDVVTRAADPEASAVELWRYFRAVKELLLPPGALVVGDCIEQGIGWSEPVITDRDSGDELNDIPGIFIVTTYETP